MRDRRLETLDPAGAVRDAVQIANRFKAEMRRIDESHDPA